MPSFLTTPRMHPELRARVLSSLRTDARARVGGANLRRGRMLFRTILTIALLLAGTFLILTYRQSREDFRLAKVQLSQDFEEQVAPFDDEFLHRMTLIDDALKTANAPYPGDMIDEVLHDAFELEAWRRRPLAFVRGPIRAFDTRARRRAAFENGGADALLRCLSVPPLKTSEAALLRHLGQVYQPRTFRGNFFNAGRGYDVATFLQSSFSNELSAASRMKQIQSLKRRLDEAHLDEATPLAGIEVLFAVYDEDKAPGSYADFDGEAEHFVRLIVVDLVANRTVLRLRRKVDPSWISDDSRIRYSRELDSCRLAADIRDELSERERSPPAD